MPLIDDEKIQASINEWLAYYTKYGGLHYNDTKDETIRETYADLILDKVLEDCSEFETDETFIIERFNKLYNL